jgi:signal transduction histidine kinase/CheY-like chemotaxis protein
MANQPNKNVYNVVVVIWLTLSMGSMVLAAVAWAQLEHLMNVARQNAAIKDNLRLVLNGLLDAETGARGYVITGNKNFLQPFNESVTNLPVCFDALAQAAQGESSFTDQLDALHTEAQIALDWQVRVIAARDRGFARAMDLISTGDGKSIMDGVRRQIADLTKIYLEKRAQLREGVSTQLFRASLMSLGAGILGLGAGIYAFRLSRVTLKHQQRERDLTAAKLAAEHNNEKKNIFLANMSHEIRTPMNAILGFSELLRDELSEPAQRQYAQAILISANSLLTLINDVLDVSKIEAGVMVLRPEPTDPREICDLVHALFAETAAKKGIKLQCQVTAETPRSLLVDRVRLRQILMNVVGNAVKFTDAGSVETRVSTVRQPDSSRVTLVIEVQDTGTGIPPDKLGAIFKPFAQAGAHRDKENQGSGLGLAIVKRLVELMGGTVTVASIPGQGSAFHLRFPDIPISARLASSARKQSIVEADFDDLRAATFLVVDDNVLNCQLIAGMFAGTHHRLAFASTGEEALAKVREIKPEIILLDNRLPGISGQEALLEIRKIAGLELVPIIAVTASALLEGEVSLKDQFSGYVRKPFTRGELFKELSEFLPAQPVVEQSTEPPSGITGPVAPELVACLRKLLKHPWPVIRDSVGINESRDFASNLSELGGRWRCPALVRYAQTILNDVEKYAVMDLENHLAQFAALVEQLEQATPVMTK